MSTPTHHLSPTKYVGIIVFCFCVALFAALFARHVLTDTLIHAKAIVSIAEGKTNMYPNAMFYCLTWCLSGFSKDLRLIMGAAVIVLAAFGYFRWWILNRILLKVSNLSEVSAAWWAFALMLVTNLPTPELFTHGCYLCYAPAPNNWMNSTIWVSWPFALILFDESLTQLRNADAQWVKRMLLWGFLLLLSKPSFLFVFISIYPLMLLWRQGWNAVTRLHLGAIMLLLLGIAAEYLIAYYSSGSVYVQYNDGQSSGLMIAPFYVWAKHSEYYVWPIMAAIAFPLWVLGAYWHRIKDDIGVQYAWFLWLVGMLLAILFVEKGAIEHAGNMRWQMYICSSILFLVSVSFILQKQLARTWRWRVSMLLFGLHLLSGLVYLGYYYYTRHY